VGLCGVVLSGSAVIRPGVGFRGTERHREPHADAISNEFGSHPGNAVPVPCRHLCRDGQRLKPCGRARVGGKVGGVGVRVVGIRHLLLGESVYIWSLTWENVARDTR